MAADPGVPSTPSSPFAFENRVSAVEDDGLIGVVILAESTFGGTAAFPRVVRNASRGVVKRKTPATWLSFWKDRTRP
jgi:hypothetical protein